jgi:Tfp pilus assembly protein PilN
VINLLPSDIKQSIAYARKNSVIWLWVIILWIFLLLIALVISFGIFFINQRANNLNRLVTISDQRVNDQQLKEYQQKAEVFSNDLNTAVKLLEDQLLFSKIIKTIGAVLPPGVTLGTLDYSVEDEILTLNIEASNQRLITTAFENISNGKTISQDLFTKADLLKIDCNPDEGLCTGSIVVLLNKNSNFYLLNEALSKEQN